MGFPFGGLWQWGKALVYEAPKEIWAGNYKAAGATVAGAAPAGLFDVAVGAGIMTAAVGLAPFTGGGSLAVGLIAAGFTGTYFGGILAFGDPADKIKKVGDDWACNIIGTPTDDGRCQDEMADMLRKGIAPQNTDLLFEKKKEAMLAELDRIILDLPDEIGDNLMAEIEKAKDMKALGKVYIPMPQTQAQTLVG